MIYHIFISHAWKYNESYYNLEKLLKDYPNFNFKNYSVPQHDALDTTTDKELKNALYNQIKPCSVVLIIAGMYFSHRKWIQEELNIAQYYNKPIIVIRPFGQERLPNELTHSNYIQVNWQTKSIVDAIQKYSLK